MPSSKKSELNSGVTGQLFIGEKIHLFAEKKKFQSFKDNAVTEKKKEHKWAVCTTINKPSLAIIGVSKLEGWSIVVVGDIGTPRFPQMNANFIYLDPAAQKLMETSYPELLSLLPWRHFGRKNLGYLYAILHGANAVWDFDDDNILKEGIAPDVPSEHVYLANQQSGCPVAFNPYPLMGAPLADVNAWPRGFPLNLIQEHCNVSLEKMSSSSTIAVFQSLADHEPDVDGIFRLTRSTPFNFNPLVQNTIAIPNGVMAPYNAQAALVLNPALWSLLLPVTVRSQIKLPSYCCCLIIILLNPIVVGAWPGQRYLAFIHGTAAFVGYWI